MYRHTFLAALLVALLVAACSTGSQPAVTPTTTPTAVTSSQPGATLPATLPTAGATPTGEPAVEPAPTSTSADAGETQTPTASPTEVGSTPSANPTSPPTAQDAEFDEIAKEVSSVRELEIKAPIREDYLTREQLREQLTEDLDKEYPAEEAQADERVLKIFGLIPDDTDLRKLYLDLYTEQIAGFYDPETDEMYVISSGTSLNALEEFTYAHEVTHALQDQHYDLQALTKRFEDKNDDASLAVTALVEGDAVLLQTEYLKKNTELLLGLGQALIKEQPSTQQLDNAPPIISQTLTFPYEQGNNFVTAVWQGGGWKAVADAYADPPTSTEQILHPDKYTADRDQPTEVKLPDLSGTLGAGWKKLEGNLWGEFQTRILLEGEGNTTGARTASEGWDGDWFELWTSGNQEVVTWQSVWDSEADAREFAAALREYDEARFDSPYTDQNGTLVLTKGGRVAAIRTDGDRVSYVLAPTQELATQVLTTLGK